MQKKGFTLVELLAVIVILGIILAIAIPNIINVISQARIDSYERQKDLIIDAAQKYVLQNEKDIVWVNNAATIYLSDLQNANLLDNPLKDPRGGTFDNTVNGTRIIVTRNNNQYTYSLTAISDTDIVYTDFIVSKGVNKPKLISGMTPIKWNGTTWIDTTESDTDWYNYTTTTKQWANARTQDGSMWVWIPRYAYQIETNYHTSTVGTINIKFLRDNTNTTSDSSTITTTPTYSGNSQTNYIIHPAFTFGTTELTGIWVAKFEPSGTSNAIDIKPNATALGNLSINNMFTTARNIETNNRYGWGTTGNGLDTHMAKNIEWGVILYLAQSLYGKNDVIWHNNSSTFITGCAGDSNTAPSYAGCQYAYNSANGMQASTTGNIYGIYDINGSAFEYTASYVNNGNTALSTNGNSIITADIKYKDIYSVTTDNQTTNYSNTSSKKGDAIYETSSSYSGSTTWYSNYSDIPYSNWPWFLRGGYGGSVNAGAYFFTYDNGLGYNFYTFRPILLIDISL